MRRNFTPFISKSFQVSDHFLALLFQKDSESLKFLDMGFQELGAKRRLNGASKVIKHRDRHTDTNTYGQIILQKALAQRADTLKSKLKICIPNLFQSQNCPLSVGAFVLEVCAKQPGYENGVELTLFLKYIQFIDLQN